jgi:hypothetical protein
MTAIRLLLPFLVILAVACGESSPTAPSVPAATASTPPPVPPPPLPPPVFSGTVTDTVSGAPVLGFTASVTGDRLAVSAPGYFTRDTRAGATTVDLIPEAGFDLAFYRQFARGGLDGPPQPLRVLTQAPSFYMEVEGVKGLSAEIGAELERVARRIVPELTGGKFQVGRWETGPTPRAPQQGWIVIERRDLEATVCGRAAIGAAAGQIWLDGDRQCNIAGVFAHEVGHAFGFTHVNTVGSLMFPQARNSNIADAPTERERRHAAIAYKRSRGNRDIDVDQ